MSATNPTVSTTNPAWTLSTPSIIQNNTLVSPLPNPLLPGLAPAVQTFGTVNVPNTRSSLYRLSLYPDASSVTSATASLDYIFPLSPENLTKQQNALTNFYDVQGPANQYGVQRIIDTFGIAPPIITISGTTGWQFHSNDGYQYTGTVSILRLNNIIQQYFQLLQNQISAGNTDPSQLPVLLFSDGFNGEVFQVIPMNNQRILMDNRRPILQNYDLQFVAIASLSFTSSSLQNDPISTALAEAQGLLTTGLRGLISNIVTDANNYLLQNGSTILSSIWKII